MKEYRYLIIPIIALVSAQIIKFIIESCKEHHLKWGRLFNGCGGMPSSHTTFCFSLTNTIGLGVGYNSPLFAACLVFSLVVAYDAMGLRKESGDHAVAINHIINELFTKNNNVAYKKLKEQLGHNPFEVVMGILYGVLISYILMNI